MLFPIKNEAEVLREMMDEVVSKTSIESMNPGTIARTLLEIFNSKISACYRYFDIYTSMSFLSTASGMYLDMIGAMLGCSRAANESDTNYRYRISKQVFTAAAANATSVRLQCLSVSGVKNVIITPYSRGNGSFTVHVITDEVDTPSNIISEVEAIVVKTKAEGIKAIVTKPTIIPINIKFNVVRRNGSSISELTLSLQIKEAISDYVDEVAMGGNVSILELLRIAQMNQNVGQVYINSLYIDGKAAIVESQYKLDWDERAYVNSVVVII